MKKLIFHSFLILSSVILTAQEKDSLKTVSLEEVIVIGKKTELHQKQAKPLTSIDEYLQQSNKITMIKRGGYAWEPVINNMATERTLVTIEGMRIFGACTDKMDPITSYVEISNLSEATVTSGQQGTCHGATIGGAIDLKRNRSNFSETGWNGALHTGYETNSNQKIIGSALNYSKSKFYLDTDFMYRDADNYKAGNNEEVLFSQFRKFNLSGTSGFQWHNNKLVEASVIYDKATDVGYPALPMDVSLAEALITSLKLEYKPASKYFKNWETKLYYNTITHKMDDTKRPFVPIHMDMPGWSDTFGGYSKIIGTYKKHQFLANLNSFYNRSKAEMTMYPSDPNENLMFMYTWPDVRTFYNGLFLEDRYEFNCHTALHVNASIGNHNNEVASEFGLQSLQIFYPDAAKSTNRILKSTAASLAYTNNNFDYVFGLGYGERAPSVSEGYGFYLFNSFDRYDYIGNPHLKNEKSLEVNASFGYKNKKFSSKIAGSYFHISDYIVGKVNPDALPMTIGASGIKEYTALAYAEIFNLDFTAEYQLLSALKWKNQLVYSLGKDNQKENLPFISPLRYTSTLAYKYNSFSAEFSVQGNAQQDQFAPKYGEDNTPGYAILNCNAGYVFRLEKTKLNARLGMENILDTKYSTFADWNNIPRRGRNVFLNVTFSL